MTPTHTSPLARWDARWKLAGSGVLALTAALIDRPETAGCALAIGLLFTLLARMTLPAVVSRFGLIFLGIAPILLILPWTADGGSRVAAVIALRAFAIGSIALAVVYATPMQTSFAAATRLGMPSVLVRITQLTLRYSYVFTDELRRLRVAARMRGFVWRTHQLTYRTMGQMSGTLLVRGADRSERVADAMLCRGFNGSFHNLEQFRTRATDVLAFVICLASAAGLIVWDRLG